MWVGGCGAGQPPGSLSNRLVSTPKWSISNSEGRRCVFFLYHDMAHHAGLLYQVKRHDASGRTHRCPARSGLFGSQLAVDPKERRKFPEGVAAAPGEKSNGRTKN